MADGDGVDTLGDGKGVAVGDGIRVGDGEGTAPTFSRNFRGA